MNSLVFVYVFLLKGIHEKKTYSQRWIVHHMLHSIVPEIKHILLKDAGGRFKIVESLVDCERH